MFKLLPPDKTHLPFEGSEGGEADIDLLHRISIELIAEQDHLELYGKIVDAAVSITGSQFGTMQLLCPQDDSSGNGGKLRLLCSRGLAQDAVEFWGWVSPEAHSSCTSALRSGQREIVPDYEDWDLIAGTEDLLAFRRCGIRSAQTTPLLSRNGNLLGMISTHWSEPHVPSDRDLRLLDILARQAADLLERTIAEEASRARTQELYRTCATLREAQDLQKLLNAELSHRVKNMLATVQAIASQTLRHSDDPGDFVKSFGGRIQSMSRVHSQLSINEWKGTQLHDIVRGQLKFGPVDEAQISVSGPPVCLDATNVPMMAMILHELGTNSLKYGALSKTDGTVTIAWSVSGQVLDLWWIEHGGPAVAPTVKRGFGTKLIESTAHSSGGAAKMSIEVDGVRWNITLPISTDQTLSKTTSDASDPTAPSPNFDSSGLNGQADLKRLEGKRILIVEDEPLLAMDIAEQLEDAGASVIGPAGNASAALSLIEHYRFDGALLDANLAGHPVGDIAASLKRKNIPFVFVSGYNRDSLPLSFDEVELLSKPYHASQLLAAVAKIVS